VRSRIINRSSARSNRRAHGSSRKDGNGRAPGRAAAAGSRTAPETGPPIIAPGRSAEDMAVSISLRRVSVCISAPGTSSGFKRAQ
jgi:hypothetical protein